MRNPWDKEDFRGDWSDKCPKWTDKFKAEVRADPHVTHWKDDKWDGVFFMSYDDYFRSFRLTRVSLDTSSMGESHFLMLNDQLDSPGSWPFCGSECTRHMLTLTSEVDQTIYLTAHTWDDRGMAAQCKDSSRNFQFIWSNKFQYAWGWNYGELQVAPFTLTAGEELTLYLELGWKLDPTRPRDWSVVAFGSDGGVTLTHNDGYKSDTLPIIARQDSGLS